MQWSAMELDSVALFNLIPVGYNETAMVYRF